MTDPHETDAELVAKFKAALAKLPHKQRDIFLAYRMEDVSCAEIAELTGLTVDQVEHHIIRAMYKLMKQMDGESLTWRERWFT